MLNPQSPIPLYHQLADILMEGIRNGDYPPGARIPSETQLAKDYGIGRPTVRQAIDLLVRRHLLTRRRGSGTYVCAPDREIDLFSLAGTSSAFHKQGIDVAVDLLDPPSSIRVDGDDGNPFAGGTAFFLSRLSRVDGAPVLLEEIYLHPVLFKGIEGMDLTGRSLSQVAETQFYLRPADGRQTFRIDYLDDRRRALMDVRSRTPILTVHRYLHFKQAQNAVFSILYCNTDRFVFSQQIGGLNHE
ncbi:GntR family transcriptional regulator [Desulfosarcina ovata subsp. sediminis]|uniref:GntR family transcriptional regulator n=1 Tax=Desulfosarcina ovata subsp. sediminis TaxID=885957 RepID=A0A5K7ZLE4_9BACT|nr:GntR family transcriptional regulator [Desulfosarcina ovata]BBO82234.1 GntR family transcriptional regulator [Desulfosarcina ovata subsp. sediminis]